MSETCPIEILSDEDELEIVVREDVPERRDQKISDYDDRAFCQYMEVTGRGYSQSMKDLRLSGYDLEFALASFFEDQSSSNSCRNCHALPPQAIASIENTSNNACDKEIPLKHAIDETVTKNDVSKIPAATSSKQKNTLPSEKLNAIIQNCTEAGMKFVDDTFPPCLSSLDGKHKGGQSPLPLMNNSITCRCHCGIIVKARTVQSDGPNYGRFYLGCGQISKTKSTNKCNFFKWEDMMDEASIQRSGWATKLSWYRFEQTNGCCIVHRTKEGKSAFSPDAVRQGAMGNCWFLSALAVAAEKPYIIEKLIPIQEMNGVGCYEVCFFLDGKWVPVIVDSNLPVATDQLSTRDKDFVSSKKHKHKGAIMTDTGLVFPAFAAIPNGELWPAFIEKAYAKVHGSYAALSGGYISEALFDLTGAPTEHLNLSSIMDQDHFWAKMLSFYSSGFLMGLGTAFGSNGLVSCHAYSILELKEVHDTLVGEQKKMTDFFSGGVKKKRKLQKDNDESDNEVEIIKTLQAAKADTHANSKNRATLRLVRIRNPWGKKEWTGSWSADSDKWTRSLRAKFDDSFMRGDGTFYMSFDDMLSRFHHLDVAKCQKGWMNASFDNHFHSCYQGYPIRNSLHAYSAKVYSKTWAFITIVQPKKRANIQTRYWYYDPSLIILKRHRHLNGTWLGEACILQGVNRTCTCELFLDPAFEYFLLPFSYLCGGGKSQNRNDATSQCNGDFRLTTYSSHSIDVNDVETDYVNVRQSVLSLHKELLKNSRKLVHALSSECILVAVQGNGSIYFLVLNSSFKDDYLLKLSVILDKNILLAFGENDDTHSIPARTQSIILVLLSDGRDRTSKIPFSYTSDIIRNANSHSGLVNSSRSQVGIGASVELTIAGEYLFGIHLPKASLSGKGIINDFY